MAGPSSRILLAVSGGIDSMVMAHLFLESGFKAGIAHCNFNLRGEESDGDEEFVKTFAEKMNVPFFKIRFDTQGFAAEKGISIQMAARDLRYRWFEEVRVENNYDFISLAHNQNDNTETFLINLTRGTGIAGLTGMRPAHKHLIRPLLFATRNAIAAYASENSVPFREDRTNADTKYTRNKIRHRILPVFREINPSFDNTVAETAERLAQVNEIISAFLEPLKERIVTRKDGLTAFRTTDIPRGPYARTILFELFRPYGLSAGQAGELEKLAMGRSGGQLFTGDWRLVKNRNEIIVVPRQESSASYYEVQSAEDLKNIGWVTGAKIFRKDHDFTIPSSEKIASLDSDKIVWPVIIRSPHAGDSFFPLGMKSKKKLSDYFIDRKYSIPEKEKKLVLESAGKIAWIIGDRIDNRFKISGSTRNVLRIEVKD